MPTTETEQAEIRELSQRLEKLKYENWAYEVIRLTRSDRDLLLKALGTRNALIEMVG